MLFIMEGIDLAGVVDSDFQGIKIIFAGRGAHPWCFLRAGHVKKIWQTYFNKLFLLIIKRLIFVFFASMNYIFVLSQGSS